MTRYDDDTPEMPRNQPFDDDAIEAIFAGNTHEAHLGDLAAFVSDVRVSAGAVPIPSPALAAALVAGFSTDKGALPTTAASNVHGPVRQVSGLPKWRVLRMKIQGVLAGLGVFGKVALGASLAAAATTGAGAAGILPGPVQHVVATTVDAVTPFHLPGGGQSHVAFGRAVELPEPTSTTKPEVTTTTIHETSTTTHATTTVPGAHEGPGSGGDSGGGAVMPPTGGSDDGNGPAVTTTTEHHGDGETHSGGGSDEPSTTVPSTTTTTDHHGDGAGGDSNNPQSLSITCERAQNPNRIYCQWSASTSAEHDKYVLLRITSLNDPGRVLLQSADALAFADTTVAGGVGYGYRVISLRSDGTVESHSNIYTIMCCGDAGGTTSTTSTTSTTQPHESTTTTTTVH